MKRSLPPLNALRAFEAAARHLSFSKAADELGVTASAISHQVKELEERLGLPLFRRMTRKIALTRDGAAVLPLMSEGFDRLAEAVGRLERSPVHDVLTVSVVPSFAAKWLVPQIESFTHSHPEIDVRIAASMELADFRSDGVDIAIRFGLGEYPGVDVEKLFLEYYAPLCSPKLLAGAHPLKTPDDLRQHTFLHDDSAHLAGPGPDWRMWLKLAGHEDISSERGPHFSSGDHALQAAIDGQGVVLGRVSLAHADLDAGRLVRPFGHELPTPLGYFLVTPRGRPAQHKVEAFRRWIRARAELQRVGGV